jgi:hypothetical protein
MKIVASNHADTLRRSDAAATVASAVLDSVGAELRLHYGFPSDDPPEALARLAERLEAQDRPAAGTSR